MKCRYKEYLKKVELYNKQMEQYKKKWCDEFVEKMKEAMASDEPLTVEDLDKTVALVDKTLPQKQEQ